MAQMKVVTILAGLLYDLAWRTRGEVMEMDAYRAETLSKQEPPMVAFGEHVLEVDGDGNPISDTDSPTFTPPDFPGAEYLVTVGITNLDQLGEVMTTRGDTWFKGITGLGKKTAAMIADRYAELVPAGTAKPAAAAKPAATKEQPPAAAETPAATT